MSASAEAAVDEIILCASCGKSECDDGIKLKKCTACYLVRYCSVKCQKDHRPQHKKKCKKRAAELREELLFKQPESSSDGDCPICCLPLPRDPKQCVFMTCCSKRICVGCDYANEDRDSKCPFCRKVAADTYEEQIERLMQRIEANDPDAMCEMGTERCRGGDYNSAFEYYSRAAALGDVLAHYQLSILYHDGKGVEKDEKRALHHEEQAAICGHPEARHNLGFRERENGRLDRALKHWIIASKLGNDKSLKGVKMFYKAGFVSKEDFAAALRGHKAAIDATKSPQREEAAEYAEYLDERRQHG